MRLWCTGWSRDPGTQADLEVVLHQLVLQFMVKVDLEVWYIVRSWGYGTRVASLGSWYTGGQHVTLPGPGAKEHQQVLR